MKKIITSPLSLICVSILITSCGQRKSATENSAEHTSTTEVEALTPDQALAKLKSGNQNFVKQISTRNYNHGQSYNYLDQVEHSKNDQHPMAFILACMDSRVPPEIIFDQGIGELFVDRVGGNVEDQYILGSMEYAVDIKGVKLIVVLGHKNCGAIHAAFQHINPADEDLVSLVDHIKEDVIPNDPSPYDASAKHHVMKTIDKILNKSKAIRSRVEAHEVMIVGGLYDVTNGTIDWNTANW